MKQTKTTKAAPKKVEKQVWYFTFCIGDTMGGKCQPIKAESFSAARAKMIEMYGTRWAFQYSMSEWEEIKSRPFKSETELDMVEV